MNGSKVNEMTREQVMAAVRAIPAGIEPAKKRGRPAGSGSKE
jgi:hypothetical protein